MPSCNRVWSPAANRKQLLLVVAHTYILYEGCIPEKSKLRYTKRAVVVAIWLLHRYRYVEQYYSEHYNRDVQVCNLENQENFYLTRNLLIRENFSPRNILAIQSLQNNYS